MSADLPEKLLGITFEDSDEDEPYEVEEFEPEELEQYVFLDVSGFECAIHVDVVKNIVDLPKVTRVPRAPRAVRGITDLRGEITAVIDPRPLLSLAAADVGLEELLVVFDRPSDQQPAAIVVDTVIGVESIPDRDVREADEVDTEAGPHESLVDAQIERRILGEGEDQEVEDVEYVPVLDVETLLTIAGTFDVATAE